MELFPQLLKRTTQGCTKKLSDVVVNVFPTEYGILCNVMLQMTLLL